MRNQVDGRQVAVRATILLAPWLVIGAARLAGARDARGLDILVLAASLLAAWRPDSPAGAVLLLACAATWLVGRSATASPLLLVGAAGLVVLHVAILVAAQGPAAMSPDPGQLRLWAARAVVAWAAAVAGWVAVRLVEGAPHTSAIYVAGLLVVTGTAVLVSQRLRAVGPDLGPDS